MVTQLTNGSLWKDTDGNDIHAHGGHIIFYDGWYYWYGEDRRGSSYVSCYRSRDLLNWEFRKIVLHMQSAVLPLRQRTDLSLFYEEAGERKKINIERPKVLYNALTGMFVMWMHYENGKDYLDARCAVATCERPDGDFIYRGSFNPYGQMSRDCTLFEDNGKAYFISAARDNADMNIYRLAPDYLNIQKQTGSLWPGEYREAPALFRRGERVYMLSSYCTGWAPNQGKYAWTGDVEGDWSVLENFGNATTFDTQPAFVLPVSIKGREEYIYCADRWEGGGEKYFTSSYVFLLLKFTPDGAVRLDYDPVFGGLAGQP